MSRKTKKEIYKVTPKTQNKMTRVGDLLVPGNVKPGQVIIGFSEFLNKWLVYRISQSLKLLPCYRTFKSQQEAQIYGNQYNYVGGRWSFSPAIFTQSELPTEDFVDYLPEGS